VFLPLVLIKQKITAFHFSLPPVAISCTIHFLSFLYLDDPLHQRYHQRYHQLNDPKPNFFLGKNRVTPGRLDSNHHKIVSCPGKHHNKNTSNPPHHFHLAYHPKS
jgi:endoglucanase Acf2